jgi:hypothetical protein
MESEEQFPLPKREGRVNTNLPSPSPLGRRVHIRPGEGEATSEEPMVGERFTPRNDEPPIISNQPVSFSDRNSSPMNY